MLVENLMKVSLLGSEWVMWLMIGLSVLSFGVMAERWLYFNKRGKGVDTLRDELVTLVASGNLDGADTLLSRSKTVEAQVIRPALSAFPRGAASLADAIESQFIRVRRELDRGLNVLGTIGSNAPFIGLFGTVIGVIMAFAHLGEGQDDAAMAKVMYAIAEALVATAVGLFVAIPAVIGYNSFQKKVNEIEDSVGSISKELSSLIQPPTPLSLTPANSVVAASNGVDRANHAEKRAAAVA